MESIHFEAFSKDAKLNLTKEQAEKFVNIIGILLIRMLCKVYPSPQDRMPLVGIGAMEGKGFYMCPIDHIPYLEDIRIFFTGQTLRIPNSFLQGTGFSDIRLIFD